MAATYEPIATTTLGTANNTVTFSSIASSWTDLVIILVSRTTAVGSGGQNMFIRLNGDTSTIYSNTSLTGNGSTTSSARNTNNNGCEIPTALATSSGIWSLNKIDIFSYAGSTFKTLLTESSRDENGSGTTRRVVSLYRSTTAVSSVSLVADGGDTFAVGTIATLYGIKAA